MSNLHKEQLEIVFKPHLSSEVSHMEIALLARWIEEILMQVEFEEYNTPNKLMN